MLTSLILRRNADLVKTTVRPVSEDLPAFDFLLNVRDAGVCRLYQFEVQFSMPREALEVTDFFFRYKGKGGRACLENYSRRREVRITSVL